MRNLFALFTFTLAVSLILSIVRGQDYSDREGKLLHSPGHFQCDSDGFHADPNDCTIFYRCTDWGESSENSLQPRYTSFKFQCGEGTVFDIESSNCVHAEETTRTECRYYTEPYTFARLSERDAGDDGPDYGVVQQPSSGYNRPSQQPSYNRPSTDGPMPGDSGDIDNNIGEPSSQPPSRSPPCEADGFFPIQNDCTHFYRCVGNGNGFSKYEFSCGPGTVWDPDNNACNHRWAVSRTDCRAEETGSQGGPETSEGPESPEVGEQVAEPSSTTAVPSTSISTTTRPYQTPPSRPSQSTPKPTTTTRRSTTIRQTTSQLITGQSTTSQSTTSGATSTTQGPTSVAPSEGPNENGTKPGNSCESEGFFADEKDCKKFYRCVDQGDGKYTKYEFECAEGTVWDVQETTCNYAYAVQQSNCNSSNSSSTETQTATTAGESTSSTSDNSSTGTSSTSSYNNSSSTTTSQQSSSSTSTTSQQSSSSSQTTSSSSQTTSSQQTSSSSSSTSSQSTSSAQQTTSSQQSTASSSNQSNTTSVATESTASSNNSSQSKEDKCTEEGFFPSSKSCNKFFRCVPNEGSGFTKYEFNCGPGTVWDPDNNVCNHPWAVRDEKCRSGGQGTTPMGESQSSEATPPSSSTESSAQSTTSSSPNGTNGTTTTKSPGTTTSSQTSTTNSNTTTTEASNVTDSTEAASTTVSNQTISTTEPTAESNITTTDAGCTNSTTTKPSSKIKCEKAGYYPNPDDCKKFYRCVDWDGDKGERFSVYHFNCPEGTIFDPSLNVCNHEESVYPPRNCDGSGSQTTDSPTSSPATDNTTTTESSTSTETSTNTTEVTETASETTTIQTTTDGSNATESTTLGSSETTPTPTKPYESTTVAVTSTSEKATETTNPATSTVTESTTPLTTPSSQLTTTQPTTTEISTTTSPSTETCPEIEPDQFRLVCPTGFRRHPKYCNLFYQCTVSKTMDIKIVTLSCTNGTIYDEKKIQCLPPDEAKKCEGSMMADARNLKNVDDNSISPISVKSEKSICPNEGSFTYKEDCRLFYKCKKDAQGKLMGYLYQCPEGFAYWSVSKRCEKTEKVPCENKKVASISPKFTLAPVETKNVGF